MAEQTPKAPVVKEAQRVMQVRVAEGGLELGGGAGTVTYLNATTEEARKAAEKANQPPSFGTSLSLELERGMGVHVRYLAKGVAYHYLVPLAHIRQVRMEPA